MATFAQREQFLAVELEGVDDFRRALARADKQLRKRFDRGIRRAAADVRADARARYGRFYRTRTGTSARGITSQARFGQAVIYLDRRRHRPWLLGQEWGGDAPQFPAWNREGRFFWPAGIEGRDQVEKATIEAMEDAVDILTGRG